MSETMLRGLHLFFPSEITYLNGFGVSDQEYIIAVHQPGARDDVFLTVQTADLAPVLFEGWRR